MLRVRVSLTPEQLATRYGHLAPVVRRAGRVYAAAYEPRAALQVRRAVARTGSGLRRAAQPHLDAARAQHPWMFDGGVMAFAALDGDTLHLGPGRYFDRFAIGEAIRQDPSVRAFADRAAGGDPLRSGRLRGAAPGVSVLATLRHGSGRAVLLGLRRGLPVADAVWHVVPAGTMDRTRPSVDPITHTAFTEIREELGLEPGGAPLRVLGIGWDLERLFPEVVVRVDLDADADDVAASAPRTEHSTLRVLPLADVAGVWASLPPEQLSPPGAAALALLEDSLSS